MYISRRRGAFKHLLYTRLIHTFSANSTFLTTTTDKTHIDSYLHYVNASLRELSLRVRAAVALPSETTKVIVPSIFHCALFVSSI